MSAPASPHAAALAECYRILVAAARRAVEEAAQADAPEPPARERQP